MKHKIVGTYDLWGETVLLKLREGIDGGFLKNYDCKPTEMFLGADVGKWQSLVGILAHEAKEFLDTEMGCRYAVTGDAAKDNGSYLFVATHTQHSEMCARLGWFLADCLPDLSAAWKQWQKEKNNNARKSRKK